ncbi:hypothetical protein E4T42_04698 [Aureobasidium subglaciale]|nr:hypothetical protein E4T42_04698 [Aureobasidium subglaciale]
MTEDEWLEASRKQMDQTDTPNLHSNTCDTCGRPHVRLDDTCELKPSALAERIGNIPEIWINILALADRPTLRSTIRVNKACYNECLPYLWYCPDDNDFRFYYVAKKKRPDKVEFYARFVRHVIYTAQTDRGNTRGRLDKNLHKVVAPQFPNLTTLECTTFSLGGRTKRQMTGIFAPTLEHLSLADNVDDGTQYYSERVSRDPHVSWFKTMLERCPLLESFDLGEDNGVGRRDFHHFLCCMVHLKSVRLGRGNERLLIDHVRPLLKSLRVGPEWMMEPNSYEILSKMHALESLEITVGPAPVTSDKLLSLQSLTNLKHLYIWSNEIGATRCAVTAQELAFFLETLLRLTDFRLYLEFDFFDLESAVKVGHDLPKGYPRFDDSKSRQKYLSYLENIAEVELEAAKAVHWNLALDNEPPAMGG